MFNCPDPAWKNGDDPDIDCVEYDEIDDMYDPGPDCISDLDTDAALDAWEREVDYHN